MKSSKKIVLMSLFIVIVVLAILGFNGVFEKERPNPTTNNLEHNEQPSKNKLIIKEELPSDESPKGNSTIPHAVVTTFKGDPSTSRSFTWHTFQRQDRAVIQLIEGENLADFRNQTNISTFEGEVSELTLENNITKAVYKVQATSLQPNTMYTYRVGDGEEENWSEFHTFITAAADVDSFTFINVTDSQGITEYDFDQWQQTLQVAFESFPESAFIVHNGDLTEHPEEDTSWNYLLEKAKPWITTYPIMPVTGNHELVKKSADAFISHFNLPINGAAGVVEGTNYSFDYGPVHFVMLNTESKIKDQAEWLQDNLAANEQPWTIVAIHRPAFGGNQDKKVVKHLVPIFDQFNVDLVLQGHNHEYSRSYPLKGNEVVGNNERGTVYVTTNSSGTKFNEKKASQFYHQVHFQNYKPMFAALQINQNKLIYEAYSIDGKKLDEFTLERNNNPYSEK
ncbi:metallophosphoesterase [Paenibacillus yanchengensis]|uniref:Metallophosphoesterase n=1 Tax=Paenibacillus yanchengensis TaxID=2035833 RepID=A0ABW4YR84_9BACL